MCRVRKKLCNSVFKMTVFFFAHLAINSQRWVTNSITHCSFNGVHEIPHCSHIVVVFWLLFVVPFQDLDKRNKILLCMDLEYKITLNKNYVVCEKIKCLHDDFKIFILY